MQDTNIRNPKALVTTEWLADRLEDPKLRVFDCSTVLVFDEEAERPYHVLNCAAAYLEFFRRRVFAGAAS